MVVTALRDAAPTLRTLAAAGSGDTVTTLLDWLAAGSADDVVQARLLALHVATKGLLAQAPSVDQRVDLVQVSADSRTLLDLKRRRSRDKLTGLQADCFGAFYKSSWRASDWMWGRVDGAGWLVQCLLDPARLELLRDLAGREAFRDRFAVVAKPVWRAPEAADNAEPEEVERLRDQLAGEQGTRQLTRTLLRLAAATVNAGTVAFRLPGGWPQTVGRILRVVFRNAANIARSADRLGSQGSIIAATLAAVAGLTLGNNGGAVLQWVGLPILAGAVIYLVTAVLTMARAPRRLFKALGVLVVAALLPASFLPPIAQPFFGWLGNVVASWRRGEGAVGWLVASGLLVLPALVMPVSGIWRRLRSRRGA